MWKATLFASVSSEWSFQVLQFFFFLIVDMGGIFAYVYKYHVYSLFVRASTNLIVRHLSVYDRSREESIRDEKLM